MYIRSIVLKENARELCDSYLFDIPAIRGLETLDLQSPVTFFVGENGSGKSTLLEAVAVAYGFNPEGGSKNFAFSSNPTHSGLYQALRLVKGPVRPRDGFFLRAESFYNVATEVERLEEIGGPGLFDSFGGKSLHQQSHGESFLSLAIHRFWGKGVYLIDEPEAALSPSRQLTFLARMGELVRDGSQFLIVTHSPILMAYPGADILLFGEDGIRRVKYEETEHYRITKAFLESPQRMLRELLRGEEE
ncbi:AAA family ATPase [Zongyangia hominis]|nr:AAA family ATPase [Zongyangia hominis]